MGAAKQVIQIQADIQATLSGMDQVVSKVQKGLNEGATKMDVTKGMGQQLDKLLNKYKDEADKFSKLTQGNQVQFGDAKEAVKSGETLIKTYTEIQRLVGNIDKMSIADAKKLLPSAFDSRVGELQGKIETFQETLNKISLKELDISQARTKLEELKQEGELLKIKLAEAQSLKIDTKPADDALEAAKQKVVSLREEMQKEMSLKVSSANQAVETTTKALATKEQEIGTARTARMAETGLDQSKFGVNARGSVTYDGKGIGDWGKDANSSKEQISTIQQQIRLYAQEEAQLKTLRSEKDNAIKTADKLNKTYAGFDQKNLPDMAKTLGADPKKIDEITQALQNEKTATEEAGRAHEQLKEAQKKEENIQSKINENAEAYKKQEQQVTKLTEQLTQLQGKANTTDLKKAFNDVGIKDFHADMLKTQDGVDNLKQRLMALDQEKFDQVKAQFEAMGASSEQAKTGVEKLKQGLVGVGESAKSITRANQEMDQLKSRLMYFFSATNGVQLFRRAVQGAINTIKELDSVMTEAAVVTDFSIGDMWDKLPEYTQDASKLGVVTKDLYAATTLYYQQGLKTNEAMELGNATLKMAKVAGLESAEATKAMTAALRGFNMELNETSATRVSDVYSQLAAITAADAGQISTAMEKTASIAASANMEFETTAALLAQIIETTQEAPETAGTAMKTIIARFSEVKSLRDKGEITGEDEEGESIDVNRISTALGSVGISMGGFFAGTEGLDSILLKLAEKWNTLDFETQRYIATMAAGSRQQSRFIAMMSNYQRTTELVASANNSAGASQRQFEKTTESLKYKLNQLKNAWDSFSMGLTNNELIKAGVDLLTDVLNTINKITEGLSGGNGLIKSVISLGVAIAGLKLGKTVLASGLGFVGQSMGIAQGGGAEKTGGLNGIQNFISGKTAGQAGAARARQTIKNNSINNWRTNWNSNSGDKHLNREQRFRSMEKKLPGGLGKLAGKAADREEAVAQKRLDKLDELSAKEKTAAANADKLAASQEKVSAVSHKLSMGFMAAGAACMMLSNILLENDIINEEQAETLEKMGKILMLVGVGIGTIIPIIQGFTNIMVASGIKISAAWWWATLIVAALAAVVAIIAAIIADSNKLEKALENQEEATAKATEAANEAASAYSNFVSSLDKLDEIEDKFDNLTRGTEEWKAAIQENNDEVMALVDTYDGLAEHVEFDADGKMVIDQQVLEEKKKQLEEAKKATAMGAKVSKAKEYDIQNEMILRDKKFSNKQRNLVMALAKDKTLAADEKRLNEFGYSIKDITQEMKDAATQIGLNINQQNQLTQQAIMSGLSEEVTTSEYANRAVDIISKNAAAEGITNRAEEIQDSMFSTDSRGNLKDQTEEFKDLLAEEGVARTGDNKTDLQNLYMKMAGISNVEEIDEDIRNDEKKLLEAITNMKASEEYTEATEKLIKALEKMPEDMAEVTLMGLGKEVTSDTKLKNAAKFKDLGFQEYLKFTGFTAEEYAQNAGIQYRELYNTQTTTRQNMSSARVVSLFDELVRDGHLMDHDKEGALALSADAKAQKLTEFFAFYDDTAEGIKNGFDADTSTSVTIGSKTYGFGESIGSTAEQHYNQMLKETEDAMQDLHEKYNSILNKNGDQVDALEEEGFEKKFGELTIEQMEKVIKDMGSVLTDNPDVWSNLITKLREADPANFSNNLSYLQGVDWSDDAQALAAKQWMKEQGYDDTLITQYWKAATDAVNVYADGINKARKYGDKLREDYNEMNDMEKAFRDGTASTSQVEKLMAANESLSWNNFQLTLDGWKLVGASIEDTTQKLKEYNIQQTKNKIQETQLALEQAKKYRRTASTFHYFAVAQDSKTGEYKVNNNDKNWEIFKEQIGLGLGMTKQEIQEATIDEMKSRAQEIVDVLNNGQAQIDMYTAMLKSLEEGVQSDVWETSLDRQYNNYAKINHELQKRERLEKAYSRLLESEGVSGEKLVENLQAQQSSLDNTIALQGTVAYEKNRELMDLYNSEEGKRFRNSGAFQYDENGYLQINYDAVAAYKSNPDAGKEFEEFLGKMEGVLEQRETAKDEQQDAKNEKEDLKKEIRSAAMEFQTRVKEAILADRQKQIDKLSEINDSIQNTNSKLISAMQDSLEQTRQARENEKTEEELADKQRRLAYLQQDTSGANAAEILKLQKEIEEGQESYTDKLIDQKINELQKQNDKAAEQRQEQIELLQAQLEAYELSGAANEEASKIIGEGIDSSGSLREGSELERMLKENEAFQGMSAQEQKDFLQALAAQIAQTHVFSSLYGGKLGTHYATGGLADFTGPAWLDGTKSRPEYVLSASQTEAFFSLVDVLESLKFNDSKTAQNNGDSSFDIDINVESIGSDYDVERMAEKIKSIIVDSSRYRTNNIL